jgi:hypothetical protein
MIDEKTKLLRRVHVLGKEAGMDHAALSETMCSQYGVTSMAELNVAQLKEIRDAFLKNRDKESQGRRYYGSGVKDGMKSSRITFEQAKKIGVLASMLGWDETRLIGFIRRQTGEVKAVEWLMKYQASKVITGMQRIIAGKDEKKYRELNQMGKKNG